MKRFQVYYVVDGQVNLLQSYDGRKARMAAIKFALSLKPWKVGAM